MLVPRDARIYQIAVLSLLLGFGITRLNFPITITSLLQVACVAVSCQYLGARLSGIRFDALSALISAQSVCLLLRASSDWVLIAAIVIAIGSKFVIRLNGRHLFNPSNIAIVCVLLCIDDAWLSSGQWGQFVSVALAIVLAGMLVVTRAKSAPVSFAFLLLYAALVISRGLWLGDPLVIAVHHLCNGTLMIFTFFMISDPKTVPVSLLGRIFFAGLVATIAFIFEFVLYEANGPLYALACVSLLFALWLVMANRSSSIKLNSWMTQQWSNAIGGCGSPIPKKS